MKYSLFSMYVGFLFLVSCQSETCKTVREVNVETIAVPKKQVIVKKVMADAATILARKEVPILCYHNIKDFSAESGAMTKVYSVKPAEFAAQMKALAQAGYQTILPEQLYDYLAYNTALPKKPILITFDDTRGEQYDIGAAEMKKYGFKGAFFIMTVSINRPGYMTTEQIKNLSDQGHVVAAHTWDHHRVTKYTGQDWNVQLVKPKAKLEDIIEKPLTDFAYPFGLWNTEAITELKKSGYKMAFILSTKRDPVDPLYTIRRIIVSGTWSTERMMNSIETSF